MANEPKTMLQITRPVLNSDGKLARDKSQEGRAKQLLQEFVGLINSLVPLKIEATKAALAKAAQDKTDADTAKTAAEAAAKTAAADAVKAAGDAVMAATGLVTPAGTGTDQTLKDAAKLVKDSADAAKATADAAKTKADAATDFREEAGKFIKDGADFIKKVAGAATKASASTDAAIKTAIEGLDAAATALKEAAAKLKAAADDMQAKADAAKAAVDNVTRAAVPAPMDLAALVEDRKAEIDEVISHVLNGVMHTAEFQKLEASWRGLHYLVMNTETGTMLKLRLLNATQKELLNDLEKAVEFDQSVLFKHIYEDEYGTFGGNPYSLLLGDYEFGRLPQDMSFLEKMSNVAAAAHAPFIAAASPQLFDLDSFTDLKVPRDLAKSFESTELIKWRSFRESEDSRYVALVLPHVLLRLPYGPKTIPAEEFESFVEEVDGRDHRKYLWGNAAYAFGQRITNAFAHYKWTAAIRGVEGGGIVEGLPAHTFKTDEGDIALKCPTEIAITDRREKELNDLGFISLVHCKNTDYAAFFGGQTAQKPKVYDKPQATANARLSSQLPYMLAASRFAHYIKVIMRDKVGSFMSRENVSDYLNRWIAGYVLLDDYASQSSKASYPLREARVDVFDVPGKPGVYKATVFLRPHFQLDELTASIRLVAELPPPVGV